MDKYEYLSGEDLNYKPSTVEQAKFDYSSSSKFFEETEKYWRYKQRAVKSNKNKNATPNDDESFDLEKAYNEIEEMDKKIDDRFFFVSSGKHLYNFSNFLNLKYFFW